MTIKVAHLSTSNRGGAAVAAQQLSQTLNDQGTSSTLITRDNLGAFQYGKFKNLTSTVLGKLVTQAQVLNTRAPFGVATPLSISNLEVHKLLQNNFDILHIHNWYNLVSVKELKKLSHNIPIVFTFHDERLLTGGCHTTLGCQNFKNACSNCPAVKFNKTGIFRAKAELHDFFMSAPNVSAISPSEWIISQIHAAGLDKCFNSIAHIPNLISPDFLATDLVTTRQRRPFKLLFISADLGTHVKGLAILLKALKLVAQDLASDEASDIQLHLVGGGEIPIGDKHSFQVIRHGFLGRNETRKLISESSFLVVPSLSENSPNVIAEAQLVGLPVIASRIAGIPELIEDTLTGFLGDPNPQGISEAIRRAFATKDISRVVLAAQSKARERYDILSITRAHLNVYKKALANQ